MTTIRMPALDRKTETSRTSRYTDTMLELRRDEC